MIDRERLEELAALEALGLLPAGDPDKAALAQAGPEGEKLTGELALAASALAVSAGSAPPPPELREKVLAALGPARVQARRASTPAVLRLALAAAVLALVVAGLDDWKLRSQRDELFGRTADLSSRLSSAQERLAAAQVEKARQELYRRVVESEDVKVLLLGGRAPQPMARARVFWSEKARCAIVVAGNLAPLAPGKQYELWVFDKGKPVPAGVFDADASGRAVFESKEMSEMAGAQNFAVSIEPAGGMPAPTGPIVLMGS